MLAGPEACFSGQLGTAPDPLGKKDCLAGSLSQGAKWGRDLVVRSFEVLPVSPAVKTHILLGFSTSVSFRAGTS